MFTQCPECMTVFAVDAATLARAHGCVGCSECGATFDTMATLCDALPEEPFETLTINEPGAAPPLLLQAVMHDKPPQQGLFESNRAMPDESHPDHADVATNDENDEPDLAPGLPSFARPRGRRSEGIPRLVW